MNRHQKYFFISYFLIILIGIIMVYSSSYIYSKETFGSSTHFIFKHLIYLIFGGASAIVLSKTKFTFWYKNIYWINSIALGLLFLTLTPLGSSIKGSSRWISVGGFSFQPGEFVKYTVLLASIKFFMEYRKYIPADLIKYSINILMAPLLFIVQPDFGSFSIVVSLLIFNAFLCDTPRKYLVGCLVAGLVAVGTLMFAAPYRVKRLLVFLDPWSDPQNSGFQIIQSYLAFANGHIFGTGIGNSHEKLFYLPEAYNDFVFSVLGEELGFVGVLFVCLLFLSFIFWGLKIAMDQENKNNRMGSIFITSIVFVIGLQAFLNMGVVLGLLPTKGLNLPLISYGGSSLIANLMSLGFIFTACKDNTQISYPTQTTHFNVGDEAYRI